MKRSKIFLELAKMAQQVKALVTQGSKFDNRSSILQNPCDVKGEYLTHRVAI